MSAIRIHDSIPHIVRSGMQDDEQQKCWILFWRLGVKFKIHVSREDILGTPFEVEWMKKNVSPSVAGSKGWVERWHALCDCIILQAWGVLEELAPKEIEERGYWVVLRDYLHTTGWEVKMVRDEETGDAKGVLVAGEGSKVEAAYNLKCWDEREVGPVPEDLELFRSETLIVLEKEVDWRRPPCVVRTAAGEVYALRTLEKSSKNVQSGLMVNTSLDKVRAYLHLFEQFRDCPHGYPARIPRAVGVVTDEGVAEVMNDEEQLGEAVTDNEEPEDNAGKEKPEDLVTAPQSLRTLIAGILLTQLPSTQTLAQMVQTKDPDKMAAVDLIKAKKVQWKEETLAIVSQLHESGLYCGGHKNESWYYINQHLICIEDERHEVWMDPLIKSVSTSAESGEGWLKVDVSVVDPQSEFETGAAMDLKAVERVFEEWLPAELAKMEGGKEEKTP